MSEFGHAQTGDSDEVGGSPKAARCSLGLLKHAVLGFDLGVAGAIEHAAHDAWQALAQRQRKLLKRLESASRARYPTLQRRLRRFRAVGSYGVPIGVPQCFF